MAPWHPRIKCLSCDFHRKYLPWLYSDTDRRRLKSPKFSQWSLSQSTIQWQNEAAAWNFLPLSIHPFIIKVRQEVWLQGNAWFNLSWSLRASSVVCFCSGCKFRDYFVYLSLFRCILNIGEQQMNTGGTNKKDGNIRCLHHMPWFKGNEKMFLYNSIKLCQLKNIRIFKSSLIRSWNNCDSFLSLSSHWLLLHQIWETGPKQTKKHVCLYSVVCKSSILRLIIIGRGLNVTVPTVAECINNHLLHISDSNPHLILMSSWNI